MPCGALDDYEGSDTVTDDQPARLAAIDQQLAAINARLNRSARGVMRGDIATGAVSVLLIAAEVIARPPLHRWEMVITLAAVAAMAVSGYFQGLMLRSLRAEVRELRTRP
jgi:hypothetical protein